MLDLNPSVIYQKDEVNTQEPITDGYLVYNTTEQMNSYDYQSISSNLYQETTSVSTGIESSSQALFHETEDYRSQLNVKQAQNYKMIISLIIILVVLIWLIIRTFKGRVNASSNDKISRT